MPGLCPTIAVDVRALVPAPTGIGVYTRSLLEELAKSGRGRYVGWSQREARDADALAAAGIGLEVQPAALGTFWQQWQVPRRLARGDVDLFWSPLMTLPPRLPVPGVVTVHDLTVLTHPETHSLKVRLSIRPFLGRTLREAAAVVAISQATAADLLRFYPETAKKVEVVYNGVDEVFRPGTPEEVAATRREHAAPDGYLLYVGTLEPRKNLPLLLDAWERLRREDARTPPLFVAGAPGWRNSALVRRLEELSGLGLRLLGHLPRPALVRLVQAARVFVYPSLYEGFGLPPLEAMAAGVPVVVSNVSSLPEVVGEAGLKVDPGDAAELAAAITALLTDPALAARLVAAGRERALRFSWQRAAREMETIFLGAIDQHRRGATGRIAL